MTAGIRQDDGLEAVRAYLHKVGQPSGAGSAKLSDGSEVIVFDGPAPGGDSGRGSALGGSYDIDRMNAEFALVIIGKNEVVLWDRGDAGDDEEIRFITLSAFRALSANAWTSVKGGGGKSKKMTFADRWLGDRQRRTFAGIEFVPSRDGRGGRNGYLNLWRGFAVAPSGDGSCAIFKDHLLTNVCGGDKIAFRWLFAWLAQIVQQPRQKPGTAVVLRGGMGVGKTIVGEIFGSLIPRHYVLADDPRYLVGNFNMHMATCLFLQADETIWAGDKHAEGRLKGLITSTQQMIEGKGVDPVKLDNHLRLLMTSNSDWVVPAGKDERRFAIFHVAPHCAQNHAYFAEMLAEIEEGGRERLLHELLTFDLSAVNLRDIPKTGALLEQKIHSLDPVEAWLLERLQDGEPTRGHGLWPGFVSKDAIVDDYIKASERIGINRRSTETQLTMKLLKLLPGLRRARRSVSSENGASTQRVRGYDLPSLAEARREFETAMQQDMEWDRTDE